MNISHLISRIIRVSKKELNGILYTCLPKRPSASWANSAINLNEQTSLAQHFETRSEPSVFGFALNTQQDSAQHFKQRFPAESQAIIKQADDICRKHVSLHSFNYSKAGQVRWHTDPISEKDIPIKYSRYYRFNTFSAFPDGSIDPIILFKLHTHQHLTRLAQAFFLTKDEKYIEALTEQLNDWMQKFPLAHGYPHLITLNIAQRLISWCIIFSFVKSSKVFQQKLLNKFLHSIFLQSQFLYKHLSTVGLTNNFLLAECVALIMVACFFPELPNAHSWKAHAIKLLNLELKKQILDDGMSFEQSMGYQRFVIELLILLELLSPNLHTENSTDIKTALQKMLSSAKHLSSAAHDMPQFGDFSLERAFWLSTENSMTNIETLLPLGASLTDDDTLASNCHNAQDLLFWATGKQLPETGFNTNKQTELSHLFPDGGFAALQMADTDDSFKLSVDCGSTGLAGAGGHGHNDILSFVLWQGKQPIFVDSGTYTYFSSRKWRDYFRSTARHNTVQIDETELASMGPGLFQLGQCTPPNIIDWQINHEQAYLKAQHKRKGSDTELAVDREYILSNQNELLIKDHLSGNSAHEAAWHFHCHPSVKIRQLSDRGLDIILPNDKIIRLTITADSSLQLTLSDGWYSPCYGEKISNTVITIKGRLNFPTTAEFKLTTY